MIIVNEFGKNIDITKVECEEQETSYTLLFLN